MNYTKTLSRPYQITNINKKIYEGEHISRTVSRPIINNVFSTLKHFSHTRCLETQSKTPKHLYMFSQLSKEPAQIKSKH